MQSPATAAGRSGAKVNQPGGTTAAVNRSPGRAGEQPLSKSDSEYDKNDEESQEFRHHYGKARVPVSRPLENRETYLLHTDVGKTIRFVDRVIKYKAGRGTNEKQQRSNDSGHGMRRYDRRCQLKKQKVKKRVIFKPSNPLDSSSDDSEETSSASDQGSTKKKPPVPKTARPKINYFKEETRICKIEELALRFLYSVYNADERYIVDQNQELTENLHC